jgi:cobalt-zinc-cadmium efflux system outer membrane protein
VTLFLIAAIFLSPLMTAVVALGQTNTGDLKAGLSQKSPLSLSVATAGQSSTLQRLTLEDAIAMAQRSSPRLQEASAETRRARAAEQTAKAYSNPSIEVYEGRQYARPIATPGVPGLLQHYAAYQPVEIPSERAARQRVTRFITESRDFEQQGVTLSLVAETKHAFFTALRRREEISHAQENLQLVEDLRRRVEVEVRVGEKGRLELTRAEAELAQAQFAVRSAQLEYANAIARLRAVIAAPADLNLYPQGGLEPRQTLGDVAEMRQRVLQAHPAIAQSHAEIDSAKAQLDHEKELRIPQPVAFAEFENQPDLRFWRVGVTVPVPLFDRRRGQIEDAKATISRSTAVLNQRQLELTSALERSYEQYQLADQQVTSLEAGSLRAAENAVDAAKAAYRFGERGIVEVLDAQRVLQSVRGDLVDAQFARQSALVDLEELGAVPLLKVRP